MDNLIQKLPQIAAAVATPLAQGAKMIFVDNDGGGAQNPSKSGLFGTIADLATDVPVVIEAVTGVNVAQMLAGGGSSHTAPVVTEPAAECVSAASTSRRSQPYRQAQAPAAR